MTELSAVPDGAVIFVDSNIFTYFLLGGSKYFDPCRDFLNRIEKGKLIGIINDIVITETWFNYVKYKVISENKIAVKEFIQFIKKNSDALANIEVSDIAQLFSIPNIHLISPSQPFIASSIENPGRPALLSNDAFHHISMKYAGVDNIATNDPDFDGIKGITVWKP